MNQRKNKLLIEALFVFIISLTVYLANGITISSGDTIPNTLLAFNWLENHTFSFDAFKNDFFCPDTRNSCYFFTPSKNGQLISTYPIGTAIVSLPLYLLFYAYIKYVYNLGAVPLDLTSQSFQIYRVIFEKFAAAIITSVAVAIFYLSTRLKFSNKTSLLSTFIFAFATNCWMTSSQGLWQHTASNFALILGIFSLLQANRASGKYLHIWLVIAGVACGLLPSIRPSSSLYLIAAIIYSIFTYHSQSIFFFCGLLSALPGIIWNLYYFGNLTGGYTTMLTQKKPYKFNISTFTTALCGILISPSRGLLVYSPVVMYSLLGTYKVLKFRSGKDEKLIGCMIIASVILILNYSFSTFWTGGHSYGPRFMTDILPIICYLIAYFLTFFIEMSKKVFIKKINLIFFIIIVIFSLFVQFVGAFGANPGSTWNALPMNIDSKYIYRIWSLNDSQIERHMKAVLHKIVKLPVEQATYIKGLSGKIKNIRDENNHTISSYITLNPGSEKFINVQLENTGTSRWFGYQSALEKGEIRVRVIFYNDEHKPVSESRLFVSGTPKKHELTEAFASITFPKKPGIYKLVLDMISEGVGEFPNSTGKPLYEIDVNIGNQQPNNSQLLTSQIFSQQIQIYEPIVSLKAGSTYKKSIIVTNKSNFTWSNTGSYPTNFSYRWLDKDNNMVVTDGERTPLPFKLHPEESAAINAIIKTPIQPGEYTLILTMVQESVAWFSDKQAESPKLNIIVVPTRP